MLAKTMSPGESVADVLLTVDDLALFVENDAFGDLAGRVELEEGRLVIMPSEYQPHMRGVRLTVRTLTLALNKHGLDERFTVQPGGSIRLSDITAYDPDVMVIEGEGDDPKLMTPGNVVLLIEVADSSRRRDMGRKKRSYAQAWRARVLGA
jgi:Uma2 family endonuclease